MPTRRAALVSAAAVTLLALPGRAAAAAAPGTPAAPGERLRLGLPEPSGPYAVGADRAVLAAFFDRFLRGRDDRGVLDGPSPRLPDVRFFS